MPCIFVFCQAVMGTHMLVNESACILECIFVLNAPNDPLAQNLTYILVQYGGHCISPIIVGWTDGEINILELAAHPQQLRNIQSNI
jgi:hypothetical protein